ncbi:MAG: acyl-CoA thioester hydrolase [Chloroflexota bacterium]|jgi:YbgC/YbaW family acyl-CoA thioester hydrolase|nr:acyl-CoA thioester hydrolase [Chloroflexota bacterium]
MELGDVESVDAVVTIRERVGQPLGAERFRVAMADTDAAGIIYYAAPLGWAEGLSMELLRHCGLPISGMLHRGHGTPVVRVEVDYQYPLRLDDVVDGTLHVRALGLRSLTLESRFCLFPNSEPAVTVTTTMVYASGLNDGRVHAEPLPPLLAARLRAGMERADVTERVDRARRAAAGGRGASAVPAHDGRAGILRGRPSTASLCPVSVILVKPIGLDRPSLSPYRSL